ncbi:MAG: protein-L-isoaspartate(D-aspartate) O-methyltransferase [Bacteroidota bacterium]|nr:protein-L-isoaspartate(D-aspartate) O-methyltransferase [Bacteroidota bacterium]MDP4226609.1 protein-L-isoaspartate(D-aspartate) O-methyltransferase [Bacteroidota bacterium]MDP4273812.1 protein-L-isoaspartate(D-aspartate) O-methyltransferase [Bacteroidota bacterium]
MQDTFRHKGLRLKLIEEIRGKGIKDEKVLEAMNKVPRHAFMESGFVELAYKDRAFPIGAGQTISQPYTVAFQTQLLEVKDNEKILEIGTGSGYQTAILFAMGAKVYTIERQRELFLKAQTLLMQMGYPANFFYGDGNEGLPSYAPFDKILITAGATEIPKALLPQLKVGGRMVLPLGDSSSQVMTLVEKISETEYRTSEHGTFSFVPLLKGKANSNDFYE